MSDSRLEKFIYAICSMDVSDLPVPLSRIEKLWNCLITGETPDFEPLSRNEKYLMAMLDRYDISNLPAPMSRGEKLLYKIAVGETDLSDVPDYLSRYEELLKYLIENGEISEDDFEDDFEYVLYTLNQSLSTLYLTAEKPVKSAILKGQTLVNIKGNQVTIGAVGRQVEYLVPTVKPNTRYLITYDLESTSVYVAIGFLKDTGTWSNNLEKQGLKGQFILNSGDEPNYFRIGGLPNTVTTVKGLNIIEYQEGMENWDIPYFEGMQSVKLPVLTTTGKNLIKDISYEQGSINGTTGQLVYSTTMARTVEFIKLRKNITYTFSVFSEQENVQFREFVFYSNANLDTFKNGGVGTYKKTFTYTPQDDEFCRIIFINSTSPEGVVDINPIQLQLEQGSTATTYEPYKSNILTVNEEVELRGIGDVRDELNLLTGEVTERIGENVFDGSDVENISIYDNTFTNVIWFKMLLSNKARYLNSVICDRFKTNAEWGDYEEIQNHAESTNLFVSIKRDRLDTEDVNGFKTWLSQNPITVQYEVETELIKTVDLTVVDQDNQPTKLGTFENVTHVSLEAENLIPEVEMKVATHISEELASASPLMDDISNEQQQLNTTVDEQSENVDATMIATTEIFEETL